VKWNVVVGWLVGWLESWVDMVCHDTLAAMHITIMVTALYMSCRTLLQPGTASTQRAKPQHRAIGRIVLTAHRRSSASSDRSSASFLGKTERAVHASHSYPDGSCLRPCGLLGPSATAVTLFFLSRGYTEQQEWVWSLSSTLGREVWVILREGGRVDEMREGEERA
jgi:hypothetical protein